MEYDRIEDLLQQGIELHKKGQFQEADSYYRQVLAIDPENADAIHLLGLLADAIGDSDLATDLIKFAIGLRPGSAVFRNNLANISRAQGKHEEATACYLEALKINPAYFEAAFNLANLYRDLGQLEEAIHFYQQATTIDPDFAITWINQAEVLHGLGRLEESIQSYRRHLELKPDDIYCKTRLADTYFELGRKFEDNLQSDAAMASFESAISILPSHTASRKKLDYLQSEKNRLLTVINNEAQIRACLQIGLEMHKNDRFHEATLQYNNVIAMDKHNAKARRLLELASDAIADQEMAARLVADVVKAGLPDSDSSDNIPLSSEEFQDDGYTFTQAMYEIWESRLDLQKAFDISKSERRFEYCKWLLMHGFIEQSLTPDFYPEDLLAKLVTVNGIAGKRALSMLLARSKDCKQVSVNGVAL